MQAQQTLNLNELGQLKEKIKDIRIAMLTTQQAEGDFHTRPMATHEIDSEGCMWFFTYNDSNKIAEIQQNSLIVYHFGMS